MGTVWSCEIVEPFPFVQLGLEVDVALVTHELIEFLLIGSVGSLHFPIQLGCAAFDVGMPDPEIFNMPMEFGLKLVSVVGAHFTNAEREHFNDVINEVDRACALRASPIFSAC